MSFVRKHGRAHTWFQRPEEINRCTRQAPEKYQFCHDSNACDKERIMNIELNRNGLCLKPQQLVKVRGGRGHSIVCHSGSVWVTQDGDPRDVILRAGEAFTLDRDGPALVQALEPGAISIAQAEAQTRASRLAALLKSALSAAGFARGALAI
jgi:hypothetical protein